MGPEGRDSPQVVVVEVTVPSGGSGRWVAWKRGGRRRGVGVGVAVRVAVGVGAIVAIGAVAAIVAIVALGLGGGSARHGDPVTARGPAGVAAAYGYPLDCVSVTIPAADRTYARAYVSHARGCGGNTGYAPAIFHYAGGRWRLVPDAIGYMCNREAVPAVVDRAFGLCVGTLGQGCARIGVPGQGRPAAPLGWPCAKLPEISGVV